MTIELTLLGWTLLLAVAQILLASTFRTMETGASYNGGPRDSEGPPVGKITGRLKRAQNNLLETLPLFIAAVLMVAVLERESTLSLYGAWTYFIARIVYVPLYAMGIPMVRSLAWLVSMAGLLMVLASAMLPV